EEIFKKCQHWAQMLKPFIIDTTALLHRAWKDNKNILFEGAQGTLLDLDHGTFPFVTSSNSGAGGLSAVSGMPAKSVDSFIGVAKAYSTRVGAGPFPSEQNNDIGDLIRERGHEYGTTTGRPRRCGWFDAVCVDYSIRIGGIDQLALQHLDTLSGMKELKVCTAYHHNGDKIDFFPAEMDLLQQVECEYETLEGFDQDVTGVTEFDKLPEPAKNYVIRLEKLLGIPITMVGVGPSRDQMLFRQA
ncbi:MAG: adenylosuccinate synthetase, partial [Planctomycetes bacterium]|nr:adenylosuccinate synthetase [Planctomycetota bacterium]